MFSEYTRKRLRRFRNIKRAYFAFWLLVVFSGLSFFAEFIANNRPIFLMCDGRSYVPIAKVYPGTEFGLDSPVEPDYRELAKDPKCSAVWPPIHWGYNESNQTLSTYPAPPQSGHPFGTDDRGRDLLTRLIYGYRVSFVFGLINLVLALGLAILIGGVQGYMGGAVDLVGQRAIEVWSALPYLYVLILIVNIFDPGIPVLILVSAMFIWIRLSYYVRAEFLKLRKLDFVTAARSLGATHKDILVKHIVPNAMTPILTFGPFIISIAITNLAILDYLGLGVPAPTASLGELLRQARTHFLTSWWLAVYPFGVLVSLTTALYFVGEGLRESFDPKK